jgi:hypothetical protein
VLAENGSLIHKIVFQTFEILDFINNNPSIYDKPLLKNKLEAKNLKQLFMVICITM